MPLTLWLLGLVAKIALSSLVDDALATWVGGLFGFLGVGTLEMWLSQRGARRRPRRSGR